MILSIQLTGKHMLNLERSSILLSKKLKKIQQKLYIDNETIQGTYLAKDLFDTKTGIIFFEAGDEIDENVLNHLKEKNRQDRDIKY